MGERVAEGARGPPCLDRLTAALAWGTGRPSEVENRVAGVPGSRLGPKIQEQLAEGRALKNSEGAEPAGTGLPADRSSRPGGAAGSQKAKARRACRNSPLACSRERETGETFHVKHLAMHLMSRHVRGRRVPLIWELAGVGGAWYEIVLC
jgi:hypothetical protein